MDKHKDRLLTIDEVANRLSCAKATIRKWIFYKTIPVVRVMGTVRVKESTVDEIVENGLPKGNEG